MKYRGVVFILILALSAAWPLPPSAHSDSAIMIEGPEPVSQLQLVSPFDPVFAIMNQPPSQMGCVGCHISPQPQRGIPWFGKDKPSVLQTLETGVTPNGDQLPSIPVEGGRSGIMGRYIHDGIMPLDGTPWNDAQLSILDQWLITYED